MNWSNDLMQFNEDFLRCVVFLTSGYFYEQLRYNGVITRIELIDHANMLLMGAEISQ